MRLHGILAQACWWDMASLVARSVPDPFLARWWRGAATDIHVQPGCQMPLRCDLQRITLKPLMPVQNQTLGLGSRGEKVKAAANVCTLVKRKLHQKRAAGGRTKVR